jgi:hypothetical protein
LGFENDLILTSIKLDRLEKMALRKLNTLYRQMQAEEHPMVGQNMDCGFISTFRIMLMGGAVHGGPQGRQHV